MEAAIASTNTVVLDKVRHERLLMDIDHICQVANIPKGMITHSATEFCAPEELEWLRNFRIHQAEGKGLLLTGAHSPSVEQKMMAMTAALLRNFIDARVLSINRVIECLEEGSAPDASVLLIPNFHRKHAEGRVFQAWKIQAVYDLLLSRLAQGKINVLYVESMSDMAKEYGSAFADHLALHYKISEGD